MSCLIRNVSFLRSITKVKSDLKITRGICTSLLLKMDKKEHLDHTANNFRIPDLLDCKISRIEDISPTIRTLSLHAENPRKINFKSGQWVDFFIPGERQVGGFSMWNDPQHFQDTNIIELAIKFSKWAPAYWVHTQCKEGDSVQARFGGDFHYPPINLQPQEDHNILLIGGGVGINPLLSIWLHASQLYRANGQNTPKNVSLLYSAVSEEELIFRSNIEKTCHENKNFKVDFFTTRQKK
eukprot:TRINITY_DN6870_c0_g1_i1.p1 TRINITY_DN6870_c0_g1~~TRINITY_DN6870_c0_g1_i1.p1  ORF type:complete len:239 (+),score=-2.17 TRINITY_DN6870_c0_g1_i1:55-771(+)